MNNQDLRYKIAQMLIVGFDGMSVDENSSIVQQITDYGLGGVILFDYNFNTQSYVKNIKSPEQVLELNKNLQKFNHLANKKHGRQDLPLFISVDYEGGRVDRLKESYGFPKTFSADEVAHDSLANAAKIASDMAITLKNTGFNVNFAPVVDVNVNTDNPILGKLGRCFGEDAGKVAKYASIYAQEFLKEGILPVFKHFPGHGSSNADSHLGFVDVTDNWQLIELTPYKIIEELKSPNSMIMTAHIINRSLDESGLPATLSQKILTGLLRKELGYTGVIISDDMQMKAIADNYSLEDSLTLALQAGVDMFIFGNQLSSSPQDISKVIDIIVSKVQQGVIDSKHIDEAFARIKTLKSQLF